PELDERRVADGGNNPVGNGHEGLSFRIERDSVDIGIGGCKMGCRTAGIPSGSGIICCGAGCRMVSDLRVGTFSELILQDIARYMCPQPTAQASRQAGLAARTAGASRLSRAWRNWQTR